MDASEEMDFKVGSTAKGETRIWVNWSQGSTKMGFSLRPFMAQKLINGVAKELATLEELGLLSVGLCIIESALSMP